MLFEIYVWVLEKLYTKLKKLSHIEIVCWVLTFKKSGRKNIYTRKMNNGAICDSGGVWILNIHLNLGSGPFDKFIDQYWPSTCEKKLIISYTVKHCNFKTKSKLFEYHNIYI